MKPSFKINNLFVQVSPFWQFSSQLFDVNYVLRDVLWEEGVSCVSWWECKCEHSHQSCLPLHLMEVPTSGSGNNTWKASIISGAHLFTQGYSWTYQKKGLHNSIDWNNDHLKQMFWIFFYFSLIRLPFQSTTNSRLGSTLALAFRSDQEISYSWLLQHTLLKKKTLKIVTN